MNVYKRLIIVGAIIVVAMPILIHAQDSLFAPAVNYTVGSAPWGVFGSDIDSDGDNDIVVANEFSNDISVLKNTGNGTFQTPVNYSVGDGPISVVAADLDNDGDKDLAVGIQQPQIVSIMKNDGDGNFQVTNSYNVGELWSVFLADINNDAYNDLILVKMGPDHVSIMRNNSDGTFQSPVSYDVGISPISVFVCDVDVDGNNDLIVANHGSNSVSILINNNRDVYYVSTAGNDSTGDGSITNPYKTIKRGVDAAVDGDTVLVGDGTYSGQGNRDIVVVKPIIIKSLNGWESTIINCEGTATNKHWAFVFDTTAFLEGFTIINGTGHMYWGGAITCMDGVFKNCNFSNNSAYGWCQGYEYDPGFGGAIAGLNMNIIGCIFYNNQATIYPTYGYTRGYGGAIFGSSLSILNSTFIYNTTPDRTADAICASQITNIENTIIAFSNSISWCGNYMGGQIIPHQILNCDIYNAGNPSFESSPDSNGNFSRDPLLCDVANNDFHLWEYSPCIGAGLGGVDIGALGVGCYCSYMSGDINGDGSRMGSDITYGVRYLKAIGPPPIDSCYVDSTNGWLYMAGDVNGNCEFRGSDITRLVSYFKGYSQLSYCHFFPPPLLR